jgi:selenide, water dikinase
VKLTQWTSCGGCAAKWGASPLDALVKDLAMSADGTAADLLVGLAPFDDAAVYRLAPDVALVSTTDFFPPLVDGTDDFGAIAAANALSDVFAMGGQPRVALNIAAFPEAFPADAIAEIFAGAAAVVRAAGAVVAGGHTIRSEEPIFGLAVQGVVHPDRIWTKAGAQGGDVLVLSKPIGSGIVLAADDEDAKQAAIATMRVLNAGAAGALAALPSPPHAVTDVTGYGLLGHAWEMAERSGARFEIDAARVPLYDGALRAAAAGVRTGGDARNRGHLASSVGVEPMAGVSPALEALAYDPQTSGGLLAAVDATAVDELVDRGGFTAIGRVERGPASILLT